MQTFALQRPLKFWIKVPSIGAAANAVRRRILVAAAMNLRFTLLAAEHQMASSLQDGLVTQRQRISAPSSENMQSLPTLRSKNSFLPALRQISGRDYHVDSTKGSEIGWRIAIASQFKLYFIVIRIVAVIRPVGPKMFV